MSVKVHLVRFYNLEPYAVKFMAYEEEKHLLALSRADNSIEIWNVFHAPFIERTLLGTCGTVEGLVWFEGRLFSVGLQGSVIEYDLFAQSPKSFHPVTGGACWCVASDKKRRQLAAGTEDGYINIFDIKEDELIYNRILDRQVGRIVCISWDTNGDFLVTGSIDAVRIWNIETGHAIHRMTTGRSSNNKETTVWCLAITKDFTIISGDSRGKLCFWDGHTGTSITSYQSHKEDILTLALDKDQNIVYCAGIDPLIATYERVKMRNDDRGKWVKSIQRVIHDHDVKALAVCDGKLFSAGVDGYLALSSYPPKVLLRFPPLLQGQSVTIGNRTVLLRYQQCLELWLLSNGKGEGSQPLKLLNWKPMGGMHMKSAAVSRDDSWLAASTLGRLRLYHVELTSEEEKKVKLTKVNIHWKGTLVAHHVCFSKDSKFLAVAAVSGDVLCIGLSRGAAPEATIKDSYQPLKTKDLKDSVHLLAISEDATYIVAADLARNIVVWSKGKVHCKLPRYSCPPAALAVQEKTNILVVAYPDHKIIEYSIENRELTKFCRDLETRYPQQWLSRSSCITNIVFDPLNENIIILHDDSTIMVINKSKCLPETGMKIPRLESSSPLVENSESYQHYPMTKASKYAFHVVKKYKHLVHFGSLANDEYVAVEVTPTSLKEKLPPSTKQKRFGTK